MADSTMFHKFVKIDDHVQDVAEEPWSLYWGESKTGTPDFEKFILDPLPVLVDRLGISDDYHVQTTLLNHHIPHSHTSVCSTMMVIPKEKRVVMTLYKHSPDEE